MKLTKVPDRTRLRDTFPKKWNKWLCTRTRCWNVSKNTRYVVKICSGNLRLASQENQQKKKTSCRTMK